jgi:hypothetical protein
MEFGRVLFIAVLAIGGSALAPADSFAQDAAITAPVRSLGRMHFWFYSRDAAERFLTEDRVGVSAITYAGPQDEALNAKINASGLARVAGVGGIVRIEGQSVEDGIKVFKKRIDKIIADGVDAIYVDEPVGAALIMECGADCYDAASFNTTDKGVRFLVDAFNELGDYFRTKRPGGQFGICVGDGGGLKFHEAALAAGLREDFVCLEQYGNAHRRPFDDFRKKFPNIKTMLLAYNTRALCSENDASAFDTWGFWNLDNFMGWIPGPRGDADWLANAKLFSRGDVSFCQRPISQIASPLTHANQTKDFDLSPLDSALVQPAPFVLGDCEYRVVSSDAETRAWTTRACNKPFRVTVGPGKDCRDNGQSACMVYVRARTTSGGIGNTQFTRFNIAF